MKPIWEEKDAKRLNAEFLNAHKNDLRYVLQGARMLYHLEPQQQETAISLVTCLEDHVREADLQVRRNPTLFSGGVLRFPLASDVLFPFQNCTDVLDALINGDFGSCPNETEKYRSLCRERFPHALAFRECSSVVLPTIANHVAEEPSGQGTAEEIPFVRDI